jgi:hypothetical protein
MACTGTAYAFSLYWQSSQRPLRCPASIRYIQSSTAGSQTIFYHCQSLWRLQVWSCLVFSIFCAKFNVLYWLCHRRFIGNNTSLLTDICKSTRNSKTVDGFQVLANILVLLLCTQSTQRTRKRAGGGGGNAYFRPSLRTRLCVFENTRWISIERYTTFIYLLLI